MGRGVGRRPRPRHHAARQSPASHRIARNRVAASAVRRTPADRVDYRTHTGPRRNGLDEMTHHFAFSKTLFLVGALVAFGTAVPYGAAGAASDLESAKALYAS